MAGAIIANVAEPQTKPGQVKQTPAPPAITPPNPVRIEYGSVSDQEAYQTQQQQMKADALYQQRLNQLNQVATIQQKQDTIKNINDLQKSYSESVQAKSYKQTDNSFILPEQHTAKSLDQAKKEYDNIKVPDSTITLKSEIPTDTNSIVIPSTKTEKPSYAYSVTLGDTGVKPSYAYSVTLGDTSTLRQKLAEKEGSLTGYQGNEAVSLLKFPFIGNKVTSKEIPSTSLADALQFLPIGLGGKVAQVSKVATSTGSKIAEAVILSRTQSTINRIQSALREENLIIGNEKTANPKVIQISQGTLSKSGIESFNPKVAPEYLGKLESGQMATIKPNLGNIKETETITSIGRSGEAKPMEVPATIRLDSSLEGRAIIPTSFVNLSKEGSILLVREEAQKTLPPNAVLVSFQGVEKEAASRQAGFYGLSKVEGMKNEYYGILTPELAEKLNFDIKGGAVATGTDLFEFNKKEFTKDAKLYSTITQHPEVLSDNNLQRATRPFVIRYFEAKGYTKSAFLERKPLANEATLLNLPDEFPKQSMEEIKERYPLAKSFEPSQIGTGKTPLEIGTPSKGASTRVSDLISTKGVSSRSSSFSGKGMTQADFIFETLRIPPKTSIPSSKTSSNVITKSEISNISKSETASDLLSKRVSDTLTINKEITRQASKSDLSFKQNTKQDLITSLFTGQVTRQTTKQTTTQPPPEITDILTGGGEPPPPTTGIPAIRFFSNEKEKKNKKGKSILFLGNAPQSSLIGLYKRDDIITGTKRINKLSRKELLEANKPYGKFITHKPKRVKVNIPKERFSKPKKQKLKEIKF